VIRLSFDEKALTSIPEEVYRCINLEEIEFVNERITQLPSKLRKLKKLHSIYVYNNEPAERLKLKRNRTVKKLIIRGSYGALLPVSFKKLRNLDTLDLKKNLGMTAFPGIFRNKKLSKLVLSENDLTLSDLKKGSRSLKDLNLSKNKITSVPEGIGKFPQLKNLELSYNQIARVSAEIGKLKSLETISFYQNKLTAIPSGIFRLTSLRSIDLYYNRLDEVDPAIGNMTQLRILFLSNNFIKALPASIGNLSNLLALYVHHNDLDSLPLSLGKLKQLRRIGLNDNNLKEVPLYFLDFKELEDIDLSGNKITMFPIGWTSLSKLQTLGIYGNPFGNTKEVDREVEELTKMGTICRYKLPTSDF
jgi:Leucine-rich repeat (LRR) protein